NPEPYTLNPTPEPRNPKPETRNPTPQPRNPKPETRNPKPETLTPPPPRSLRSRADKPLSLRPISGLSIHVSVGAPPDLPALLQVNHIPNFIIYCQYTTECIIIYYQGFCNMLRSSILHPFSVWGRRPLFEGLGIGC
ncbi:hypothetical protein T484DRAFT_1644637, partial [Baffinella frigidus]